MTKILGFIRDTSWDKLDAVNYYRTYLPLREINRRDNGISAMCAGGKQLEGATDDELGGRDIYTMCRMYQSPEETQKFMDEIHRQGGVLVFDSDDDLTETYKMVSGRGEEFKAVLGIVDYVTTSTRPLAGILSPYTKRPPVVLQNCVDVDWMQETAKKSKRVIEGLTLGFSGSPTHWGDWYIPAVPFAQLGAEYKETVTLVVHGEAPRYLEFAAQKAEMISLGSVPFSVYPVLLSQFDMLICAVDGNDPFNQGKSAVKALECMALGVIPICSNWGAYRELAKMGAPVVLVQKSKSRESWRGAMRKLIEDPAKRAKLSAAGPKWVKENRDMVFSGYLQWQEFYRSIAE